MNWLRYSRETVEKIRPGLQGGIVTISKSDKAMEYSDYARHCLKIVMKIPDQASRVIHREMAAEWFKLADQAAADAAPLVSGHHHGERQRAAKITSTARS